MLRLRHACENAKILTASRIVTTAAARVRHRRTNTSDQTANAKPVALTVRRLPTIWILAPVQGTRP